MKSYASKNKVAKKANIPGNNPVQRFSNPFRNWIKKKNINHNTDFDLLDTELNSKELKLNLKDLDYLYSTFVSSHHGNASGNGWFGFQNRLDQFSQKFILEVPSTQLIDENEELNAKEIKYYLQDRYLNDPQMQDCLISNDIKPKKRKKPYFWET